MAGPAIAAVLCAALLHALWNTLLKAHGGALSALGLPFVAAADPASWPFITASALVHILYFTKSWLCRANTGKADASAAASWVRRKGQRMNTSERQVYEHVCPLVRSHIDTFRHKIFDMHVHDEPPPPGPARLPWSMRYTAPQALPPQTKICRARAPYL
jgi:hypothetical protein